MQFVICFADLMQAKASDIMRKGFDTPRADAELTDVPFRKCEMSIFQYNCYTKKSIPIKISLKTTQDFCCT